MGWVKTPPSATARDAHVIPLGATKTLYLIRHAEGFHNQGARARCEARRGDASTLMWEKIENLWERTTDATRVRERSR